MDLGIESRRAAVAASSAGLGYGTAKALVAAGCQVAMCGRDEAKVRAAATSLGSSAIPMVADVSSADGATAWIEAARRALGGIDILIANGGGPKLGGYHDVTVADFPRALDQSLLATVAMVYGVVEEMRAQRWGRIVAITSVAVRQPIPNLILSNTARTGLTSFLKTVARTVAADGVTVNTIQPGAHLTERLQQFGAAAVDATASAIPAGMLGDPDDFGRAAAFLCSASARFITGASLPVDGGAVAGLQ